MNSALLIIDVQQSLVEEGIWDFERVIVNLNQLIATARREKIPVILVRDTKVELDGNFHCLLDRDEFDIEIVKSFCNSFMETHLDEVLKRKNINRLINGLKIIQMQSFLKLPFLPKLCSLISELTYSDCYMKLDHQLKIKQNKWDMQSPEHMRLAHVKNCFVKNT